MTRRNATFYNDQTYAPPAHYGTISQSHRVSNRDLDARIRIIDVDREKQREKPI